MLEFLYSSTYIIFVVYLWNAEVRLFGLFSKLNPLVNKLFQRIDSIRNNNNNKYQRKHAHKIKNKYFFSTFIKQIGFHVGLLDCCWWDTHMWKIKKEFINRETICISGWSRCSFDDLCLRWCGKKNIWHESCIQTNPIHIQNQKPRVINIFFFHKLFKNLKNWSAKTCWEKINIINFFLKIKQQINIFIFKLLFLFIAWISWRWRAEN